MVKLFTEPEAPEKLASLGQVIEISEEVSQFPRLSDALHRELELLDDARVPDGWDAPKPYLRIVPQPR